MNIHVATHGAGAQITEGEESLREDPVTGSLNAAAAEWLIQTGRVRAPYPAAHGTVMGRQGRIYVSGEDGRLAEVILSGSADL